MFCIEGKSILPLRLKAVGSYFYPIKLHICMMMDVMAHPTRPLVMQSLDAQLAYPCGRHISHAPHAVELL